MVRCATRLPPQANRVPSIDDERFTMIEVTRSQRCKSYWQRLPILCAVSLRCSSSSVQVNELRALHRARLRLSMWIGCCTFVRTGPVLASLILDGIGFLARKGSGLPQKSTVNDLLVTRPKSCVTSVGQHSNALPRVTRHKLLA
jgi:hypothetical protein